MGAPKIPAFDRFLLSVAPRWAASRIRSRAVAETLARHYEAAATGRRTSGWNKGKGDANAANGSSLATLRALSRDLVRNNPWARRGLRVIGSNAVGWGIVPKAATADGGTGRARDSWRAWAETTDCDAAGRLTFYGMQRQVMETVAEAGEVLIRRRYRRPEDGLSIPLQLQILEPDFLDTTKDNMKGVQGGPIIQGVEFDAIGRRVAYWLFENHPGSNINAGPASRRYPATEIAHIYRMERPGQVRGVSWFAPVLVSLRDFDEYEDATLLRQKIAACFAAFVTDLDGQGAALGAAGTDSATGTAIDTVEPGLISYLPPGRDVKFATPPSVADHESYTATQLRRVAAGLGVTYEDMTGDYSRVNFSSARMARLAHWARVDDWRWNMLIPQFCDPVWSWAMFALGVKSDRATWTPPPMPMIDPAQEGIALERLVRSGALTPDGMVRQQGYDPDEHWAEYKASLERLDKLGIVIDSDARKVTQSGQAQQTEKPAAPPTRPAL